MRKLIATSFALAWCGALVFSQKLDHSDMLLLPLHKTPNGDWQPTVPTFLTSFNPKGYNNQPQFFSANEIYLTAQFPADTNQTEIYALNLLSRTTTRITATATPEYSPTLQPGGRRFSVVRVEESGVQRLWSLPVDRSDKGYPIFPTVTNVGYHCWLNDSLAALFLVGENTEPHALGMVANDWQRPIRVAFNIGRCLQKTSDGRLAYVHKATEQTWFIKTYDPKKGSSDIVVKTLPGSEDFALLSDGTYLAGSGAKLYQYQPLRQKDWLEIADLSQYGVGSMSRLALSADGKLAVVVH